MRHLKKTVFGFFFLFLSLFLTDLCFAYTIVSPVSSKPIIIQARRPLSTMVLKLSSKDELASLRVATAQNRAGEDQVIDPMGLYEKDGLSYIHYSLPLKKGDNTFVINPGEQELKIEYIPVRTLLNINFEDSNAFLFHRTAVIPEECGLCHTEQLPEGHGLDVERLKKNADYSPACFSCHRNLHSKGEWLHGPAANIYCMSCHKKGVDDTKITLLTGRVDDVCFQCHINKIKFRTQEHVHGPVGTGDCTICHDPHGDAYQFQLWAEGTTALCIGCHGNKKNIGKKSIGFYPHGIVLGSGCVACHSPHASGNRFQLYKPINELCISCHINLADVEKGHPVGNHPLKNKIDPRRKDRELACTSCHNPHGSNYRFLLIGDILGGHVCNKCHNN
ncbi:MAG: cytochrome c3 family protein [Proteobacteria bacterium]|nr:cytochrome c3 family protein [Pseudomonadota bacterium]